jgi:hypothetical protein
LLRVKIIVLQISILTGALLFIQGRIIASDTLSSIRYTSSIDSFPKIDTSKSEIKLVVQDNQNDTNTFNKEMNLTDTVKRKKERIPQKATIYSALLPGLGQAYNHKYWKIPIIYAAGGVIYYFINDYNTIYKDFKRLYEQEVYKGDNANENYKNYYADGRDYYRKWRDYNIIFMTILYTANIIDAMTDAYFTQFDISDDLTMDVEPAMMNTPMADRSNFAFGLKLSFRF